MQRKTHNMAITITRKIEDSVKTSGTTGLGSERLPDWALGPSGLDCRLLGTDPTSVENPPHWMPVLSAMRRSQRPGWGCLLKSMVDQALRPSELFFKVSVHAALKV